MIRLSRLVLAISVYACLWSAACLALPPQPSDHSTGAGTIQIDSCCRSDYWVISTRECPQQADDLTCCRFRMTRIVDGNCRVTDDADEFVRSLDPKRPLAIFVHGSWVARDEVYRESAKTYDWLRNGTAARGLQVVFFTWPSEGRKIPSETARIVTLTPHWDVAVLGMRAELNGIYLAQLLTQLPRAQRVSLVGHSHGGRTVCAALHLLGGGCVQGFEVNGAGSPDCLRAVLAAAAIDHDWLNPGEEYGQALTRVNCLVNLRNRDDPALAIYPLRKPFGRRALGRLGFTKGDYTELGELATRTMELDVTSVVGRHHFNGAYVDQPAISETIAPFVHFIDGAPQGGDIANQAALSENRGSTRR